MNKELAAFVCSHVFEKRSLVFYVCREDDEWQLLCGGSHNAGELPRVVGLNHLLEDDPTLADVMDLPSDWEAERSNVGGPWLRRPID